MEQGTTREFWEQLYGVRGEKVRPGASLIPGVRLPARLPVFADDGSILPPAVPGRKGDEQ